MRLGTEKFASLLLLLFMLGISAWGYVQIPDGPVPVHFNWQGVPDGYSPRDQMLLIMPGMAVIMSLLLLWLIPGTMRGSENFMRSATAYGMIAVASLMLLAVIHVSLVLAAMNADISHLTMVFLAAGALFVIIGNYLPKTKPNRVVGIRVPWTLNNEDVWYQTHRFAGPLFVIAGLAVIVAALVAEPVVQAAVFIIAGIVPSVLAIAYAGVIASRANRK